MKPITNKIIESLSDHYDQKVQRVCVGSHWTGVKIGGQWGISYTYRGKKGEVVKRCGNLEELSAKDLIDYAKSWNFLEASVGVAAINALLTTGNIDKADNKDVMTKIFTLAKDKKVSVIGHFPFVNKVREIASETWVMELMPEQGDLPASASPTYLPQSDFVLITGTTFINKTLDGLLALSKNAVTAVIGPSAPVSPVLFEYGADIIGGSVIVDEDRFLKTVLQGARCFPYIKGLKKIVLQRKDYV